MLKLLLSVALVSLGSGVWAVDNAILIGWDGADWRVVEPMLDEGLLPNLASLGGGVAVFENPGATCTTPGWACVFTGRSYWYHRCYSNGDFSEIPPWKTLHAQLKWDRFDVYHLSGKAGYTGIRPGEPYAQVASMCAYAYSLSRDRETVWALAFPKLQEAVANYKNNGKRFVFLCVFREPDLEGHQYGSRSPEYRAEIVADDVVLGQMVAYLAQEDVLDQTFISVCSDHGFQIYGDDGEGSTSQYEHRMAPLGFLANNKYEIAGKRLIQYDWVRTLVDALELDASNWPPLQGTSFAD